MAKNDQDRHLIILGIALPCLGNLQIKLAENLAQLNHWHTHQGGLVLANHLFKQANPQTFAFKTAGTMQRLFQCHIALDFIQTQFTEFDFVVFDKGLFKTAGFFAVRSAQY